MAYDFLTTLGLDNADFSKKWSQSVKEGEVGASRLSKAVGGIGAAFTLMAGPVGLVIAAIAGVVTATKAMVNADDTINKTTALFGYLANSVGKTGDALLNELKPGVEGLISDLQIMEKTNDAVRLGIDHKMIPSMVKFANANKKAGTSVTEAMDDLIGGLGRGSTELLDNLGIQIKAAQAQEMYALQLGITRKELTEVQKAEAVRVVAMKLIADQTNKMGDSVRTASDQWKAWGTAMKNFALTVYQKALVPMFNGYTKYMIGLIAVFKKVGAIGMAIGKAMSSAVKLQFSQAASEMDAGLKRVTEIEAATKASFKRIDEAAKKQREAMYGADKDGSVYQDRTKGGLSGVKGETPGDFYGRAEKASYSVGGDTFFDKSKYEKAYADFAEKRAELEEEDAKLARQRGMDEFEVKMNDLRTQYEEEVQLRLQHGLTTEEITAELYEKEQEILAEQREQEKADLADHQQKLLELKETFFNNADNLFMDFAGNQENIQQYIAAIRRGEITDEQMYQSAYKSLLANLPGIVGENGNKVVAVMKGVEAAQGLVATYAGAAKAMALPWPLNLAAAATIVSTGLGYVSQIGASIGSFSGGDSSSSTTASTTTATTTAATAATTTVNTEEKTGTLTINIMGDYIENDEFTDNLAERISEAVESRNVTLKASSARQVSS